MKGPKTDPTVAASSPIDVERLEGGAYWDVALGGLRGNILDLNLIGALEQLFQEAAETRELKVICLRGQGQHFSFGASVPEHLSGRVESMLPRFHGLFRSMAASSIVCLAAVRGNCLGGGLELVSFCQRVFASPDAKLGQPEITLGVFAPMASLLLSDRVSRGAAEDLCLSGRIVNAEEGLRIGLIDVVASSPEEAALAYAKEHLLPRSASSLRLAMKAVRCDLNERLERHLPELERLYLDELMATHDATEGLQAFLEKRPPSWRNE